MKTYLAILALLVAASGWGCDKSEEKVSGTSAEQPVDEEAARDHEPEEGVWCKGHGIPESMCTKCHPELIAKFKEKGDWCEAHGFPESGCPKCNPMTPPGEDTEAARDHGPEEGVWCKGHGIPESMCTKCHPELIAKFKEKGDWCEAHGFPESGCPKCNPMTPPGEGEHAGHGHEGHDPAADGPDWCVGHKLPESMCTRCNPELVQKFKDKGDWCKEHGFPESACPTCNPMEPPKDLPEQGTAPRLEAPFELGTIIKLKKDDHETIVGIETQMAGNDSVEMSIEAPARVEYDPNLVAEVRAPFAGIVREVLVDLGQRVEKGEPLFVLESAEIGDLQAQIRSAKQRVATAKSNFERQKRLNEQGVAPFRRVEDARQVLEEAEARYGSLSSSLRLAGASSGGAGKFRVEAPIDGVVVRRAAMVGSSASESTPLARIADSSKLWAVIDVSAEDATVVEPGQTVSLEIDAIRAGTPTGTVSWVSPEIDERTRTVRVRAEIPNEEGRLRANQFAKATIQVSLDEDSVVVPREAVQRMDDKHVVFVRNGPGEYEPREADVVRRIGDRVQLAKGVWPGEQVVTTGAYLLRTELMRDAIGAGCCEVPED